MQYFGISALFNLPGAAADPQPEGHDDTRAAAEALAATRMARPGPQAWLTMAGLRLRAASERRFAARMQEQALVRLAETSAHLLDDVGIAPKTSGVRMTEHNAHLADDIAIPSEDMMTVHTLGADRSRNLRANEPVRTEPQGRGAAAE